MSCAGRIFVTCPHGLARYLRHFGDNGETVKRHAWAYKMTVGQAGK